MSYVEILTEEEIKKGFLVGLKIVWEDHFDTGETITSYSFDLKREEAKRQFEMEHDIYTIVSEEPIYVGEIDLTKVTDKVREDFLFFVDRLGIKNVKEGSALWNILTSFEDRTYSIQCYKNEYGFTCIDHEINYDTVTMAFDTDGNIIGIN